MGCGNSSPKEPSNNGPAQTAKPETVDSKVPKAKRNEQGPAIPMSEPGNLEVKEGNDDNSLYNASRIEFSPPPQGSLTEFIRSKADVTKVTPKPSEQLDVEKEPSDRGSIDLERLPQLDAEQIAKTDFDKLRDEQNKPPEPEPEPQLEPEPEPSAEEKLYQELDSSEEDEEKAEEQPSEKFVKQDKDAVLFESIAEFERVLDEEIDFLTSEVIGATLTKEPSEHDIDIDAIVEHEDDMENESKNNASNDNNCNKGAQDKKDEEPDVFQAEASLGGQEKFDVAARCCCLLSKPEEVYNAASSDDVTRLSLTRSLPHTIDLSQLCAKFSSLKILEINGNNLGPQAFRAVMYAMATNTTITVLNIADNRADTDSAVSVGKMLKTNCTLESLNVSGNHLGNDYFSRCVGPALSENSVLQTLICESIGSTDLRVLGDNLKDNACLSELNLANNQLRNADTLLKGLGVWMQQTGCSLRTLQLRSVGLQTTGFSLLQAALANNSSLTSLDVSANEVPDTGALMDFVLACCTHSKLETLTADNSRLKPQPWKPGGAWGGKVSGLLSLSLSGCQLGNDHLTTMANHMGQGALAKLRSLNLSNNANLSQDAMQAIHTLTLTSNKTSSLERLSVGLNSSECVGAVAKFPGLSYLNLRKASTSLPPVIPSQTLVLDGVKLSGVAGFGDMLRSLTSPSSTSSASSPSSAPLAALSLGGCQLTDADLAPLFSGLADQRPSSVAGLRMLKLSGNRLGDNAMAGLVDALIKHPRHPLAVLDISNNKVTKEGAKKLCELYTSKTHKSELHSLNVANNQIESEGVCSLVSMIGKGALLSVNFSSQEVPYELTDMEEIYKQVTQALDIAVKEESGSLVKATSNLPNVPPAFSLKFLSLGGEPGELGQHLDSMAIATDFQQQKVVSLTLSHALQLAAFLQGNADGRCLLSSEEWGQMISSDKGAPQWLKIRENRERAIYFTGLPASITVQKLEGLLEAEADCEVEDICLMKDVVTKQNNGLAWALLPDEKSVHRAVDFYNRGEAVVFGSQFIISRVLVQVDDDASTQAHDVAKRDMAERLRTRRTEEAAHRRLIASSYTESQQRHAYRLAHPAYADGRIW